MPKHSLIVNLDDLHRKRELLVKIGALHGVWSFELKPYKPRRSNQANRYWFGVIVEAFRQFNAEQGMIYDADTCHAILKMELLPRRKHVSPATGEIMELPADSHTLDVEAFGSLIERAVAWLAEMNVLVPDPHDYGGVPVRT